MGALTYVMKSAGQVLYRLAALAVSMLDPPPTATNASYPPAVATSTTSLSDSSFETASMMSRASRL